MDDDQVLRIIKIGDALTENGVQAGRESAADIIRSGRIPVSAKAGKFFDDAKLFDIA